MLGKSCERTDCTAYPFSFQIAARFMHSQEKLLTVDSCIDSWERERVTNDRQVSEEEINMLDHRRPTVMHVSRTSWAKTASGEAVESTHDALIEITQWPPFLRK